MYDRNRLAITLAPSGKSLTYGQMQDRSAQLVNALRGFGLKEGDRVAVFLSNREGIEFGEVIMACMRGGFKHIALNTHLTPAGIRKVLDQLQPAAVIVSAKALDNPGLREVMNDLRGAVRIAVGLKVANWQDYNETLSLEAIDCVDASTPGDSLRLSGGSSGTSKVIIPPALNEQAILAQMSLMQHLMAQPGDVQIIPSTLYHTAPTTSLRLALMAGAHVVVMERFDVIDTLNAIEAYGVNRALLVPTMMYRIMRVLESDDRKHQLDTLTHVLHTAAPCRVDAKRAWLKLMPDACDTVEVYGSSEGAVTTVITADEWVQHPGSVGTSVDGEIIIRNKAGDQLPDGEVGIVWAAKPGQTDHMFYLGDPTETKQTYAVRNDVLECTVHDMGYLKDGYLYLVDRAKDMVVIGGVNTYPRETEDALGGHPLVDDVAVVGVPHGDLGEALAALVQPDPKANTDMLERELLELCRQQLPTKYGVPVLIVFGEVPRTPTGKLFKKGLRERLTV